MLTHLKQKSRRIWKQSKRKPQDVLKDGKYLIFHGTEENFIRNGARILEDSISLFHGKANPIRHFSVDDLNNMKVESLPCFEEGYYKLYQGSWEGRAVLVKKPHEFNYEKVSFLLEIVVASQMQTHNNAHKIFGCCLETKVPILVYEWVSPNKTLNDCILLNDDKQDQEVLKWEDRLRIAWEISHVVAYLHTAFPRPIIHGDLRPSNVLLGKDNTAKLGDFSACVSIPEGEEFVELDYSGDTIIMGTLDYLAPEHAMHGIVAESSDVYSFGMLFLVLLTGKKPYFTIRERHEQIELQTWLQNGSNSINESSIDKIVDPIITRNGVTAIEDLQLRTSMQLALLCMDKETDRRPTMVEVATQLKNLIRSPDSFPTTTFQTLQRDFLATWLADNPYLEASSKSYDINMEEYNDDMPFQAIGESLKKGTMFRLGNSVATNIEHPPQSSTVNETSTPSPSMVAQLQRQLELNTIELLETKQALCDAVKKLDEFQTNENKNKNLILHLQEAMKEMSEA